MIENLKNIKNLFDFITSNNSKNWLLALTWFFVFEFTSAVLEFFYMEKSINYIEIIPDGIYKELLIAFFVVSLVWFSIFNIVFMKIEQLIVLSLYSLFCLYLFVTHDITFSFFLHNINIFEISLDGFTIYSLIQLFLKVLIFYLVFQIFISFKNRRKLVQ